MFAKTKKVALAADLFERLAELAAKRGYASTDALVTHLLERHLRGVEESGEDEDTVRRRLQGLGYVE